MLKNLFIKVRKNNFSGGVRLPDPWEIVFESGRWIKYRLDLAMQAGDLAVVNGDLQFVRIGNGVPLDISIETIQEMATWLEHQIEDSK